MWQLAPQQRPKTPMPPENVLRGLHVAEAAWRDGAELARLSAYASDALRRESGRAPDLGTLLSKGYESLRPCLPATASATRTSAASVLSNDALRR
jgi:hypothetical protein